MKGFLVALVIVGLTLLMWWITDYPLRKEEKKRRSEKNPEVKGG